MIIVQHKHEAYSRDVVKFQKSVANLGQWLTTLGGLDQIQVDQNKKL